MKLKSFVSLSAACTLLLSFLASSTPAADAPNTDPFPPTPLHDMPSTQPSDLSENNPRVYGDFAKIPLTSEQREAIHQIQTESKAQIEKIEAEADAKARLLLNANQIKQLAELDQERKIKAKKVYEARKQKEKADMLELAKRRKEEQDASNAPR